MCPQIIQICGARDTVGDTVGRIEADVFAGARLRSPDERNVAIPIAGSAAAGAWKRSFVRCPLPRQGWSVSVPHCSAQRESGFSASSSEWPWWLRP